MHWNDSHEHQTCIGTCLRYLTVLRTDVLLIARYVMLRWTLLNVCTKIGRNSCFNCLYTTQFLRPPEVYLLSAVVYTVEGRITAAWRDACRLNLLTNHKVGLPRITEIMHNKYCFLFHHSTSLVNNYIAVAIPKIIKSMSLNFIIICVDTAVYFFFYIFWYIRPDDGCFVQPQHVTALHLLEWKLCVKGLRHKYCVL